MKEIWECMGGLGGSSSNSIDLSWTKKHPNTEINKHFTDVENDMELLSTEDFAKKAGERLKNHLNKKIKPIRKFLQQNIWKHHNPNADKFIKEVAEIFKSKEFEFRNWDISISQNLILFQYKYSDDTDKRNIEKKYYIPKVQMWLNSGNEETKEVKFENKIAILQPIGYDSEGDKIDIVYDLYHSSKKLEKGNIFDKIWAYYHIWKWNIKMYFDNRYIYCIQFNMPLNKL